MAATQHVTLTELLEVQDDAISEISGWSLLCQSTVTLLESNKTTGSQSSWLITPDTMLLYRSGAVKFCPGIPNADGNHFIAPELYGMKQFHTIDELERTYVYSLGMTIYYALEYQNDGQEIGHSERPLEAILNKMTIEAADERISLDLVYKACKHYQDKNCMLIFSNKISRMVESVLGGQLEFSYDLPDMDDECLERELQHAASMKTSSERLSSCGATGSSQSLTGSQTQGMLTSTGSFRKVARHHSNLSIRSLGSSSHDWSAGLAPSHPLPSQRWSSYDGLHVPPLLNPAALSFEGRRQLPASPATVTAQSITTRRHSVSQEAAHMMQGDIRRNEEQKLSRPKSADMSGCQETLTLPNDNKSQNNSLELPQLHPPPMKKFPFSFDTPPSPAPIAKMSPKVAASLEKINQLLTTNPPLQQSNSINSATTGSNLTAVEPEFVSSVKYHKFPPSPLLNGPLPTAADNDEVDVIEEKAPPVPLSSPPVEITTDEAENLSDAALHGQSSTNNLSLEHFTVSISSSHSKQQTDKTSTQEVAAPANFPYSSQKEVKNDEAMERYHDKHRTLKHHEHLSLQIKQYGEHQQQMLQHQEQQEDRHDILQQQQQQQQHHKQKIQQWQCKEQYQQQKHEQEQQQHEQEQQQHEQEQEQHEQEQERHEQEQQRLQLEQQRLEQEQQQLELEQQQRLDQEQQQQVEQEQQQRLEQEQQQQLEQEQQQQQRLEQEQQQQLEQEQQQQLEQEQQQRLEQEQQQLELKQQQRLDQEQQQQLEQERQQRIEQEQRLEQEQQQFEQEQQRLELEQQQQQRHEQQQPQNYELEYHKQENEQLKQKYEGGDEISMHTSMTTENSATPVSPQMVSSTEEPGYATVADTKRMVKVLKLATPYAVTELSRAHSEHQIDKNELLQPLAKRTHSVAEQMAGSSEYYQAQLTIKNDAINDNSSVDGLITTQDDCNIKQSASSCDAHPLQVKDNDVTVFPGTLQNDEPAEHSVPVDINTLKVDKKEEEGLIANSDEVKLRHTPLQTSAGLLVKSNSTQDFKDSGVEVNDPRRHSALPAAREFGSDTVGAPDLIAKSTQLIVSEPSYDEDWRQLQEVTSVEKLENVLGPEFTSLVGGKWERRAQPVFYGVHSNRRLVNVVLLNDKIYSVTVELSSKCQDVFNQVVSYLSLGEPHVFGLSIVKGEEDYFLDLNKRLVKYAPDGWLEKTALSVTNPRKAPPVFTVYFRIRFFVENVHELKMNQTRHQYYLQLRRDIQQEKVYCHEETALLLASYSLQVEKGDYGPNLEGKEYYKLEDYMPQKAIDQLTKDKINSVLPHMHSELKGISKESAEWQFLQEVQKLTEYGQIFYQLYKERHKSCCTVAIGFCVRGLVLYDIVNKDTKIPTHKLSWKQIENILFKQRRFELHVIGNDEPLVYYVSSPKKALYLFGLAKSYHYFQLKCREPIVTKSESPVEEPPRQKYEQCEVIKLLKEPGTGLGFKIMSGKKKENREGIFVKSIIKGTPAYLDGRMKPFDQIVAINGESVAGCDHREVGRMVQRSPPLIQITVIHHHHDEEERLLSISYNKQSPLSDDPTEYEQQFPPTPILSRPNYNDNTKYQTVLVTKDNDHLGFSVKGSVRGVYISNLEPGTATARKKLLQVGSIIVAVNGQSVEGQTVHEVLQLLLSSHYQLELTIQLPSDYSSNDDNNIYVEGDQFVVNIDRHDEDDFGLDIVKRVTSHGPPSGLFFVKSLIPGSPAYCCNKLMENDIILWVNDKILKDCTNDEARQVLYRAGQHVSLLVCRSVITGMLSNSPSFIDGITPPHSSQTSAKVTTTLSHRSHTSIGDTATPTCSSHTNSEGSHTSISDTHSCHEVEINVTLIKGEMAFGFKIDKRLSGQTGRGVFILEVDNEPALSDGRLHQRDEIIKVNDINLIDRPHQTAIDALRQIRPFEKANLVLRRRMEVEEFDVSFYKETEETTLGLVVGGKALPYDQAQQSLAVTILQIHSSSLAEENGLLHVGDVIDQINDVQVSGSVDKAVKMLKEAIGILTLHIFRYPSEVSEPQPILLPSEEPLSSLLTHHELLPLQQETVTTEDASVSIEDALPLVRSTTPSPPSSSPPPLSPAKGDNCGDNTEEWTEPQLNSALNGTDHNVDSCSSLDSSDAEEIFNEIDQPTVYHSNLSATVAKGINDSLGTLSNLSEEFIGTSANLLTESHNSMNPPPLPLSPPPDL